MFSSDSVSAAGHNSTCTPTSTTRSGGSLRRPSPLALRDIKAKEPARHLTMPGVEVATNVSRPRNSSLGLPRTASRDGGHLASALHVRFFHEAVIEDQPPEAFPDLLDVDAVCGRDVRNLSRLHANNHDQFVQHLLCATL